MSVRDPRRAKFHWQAPDEIEHIRYEWRSTSPSASVGLGIFRALTELATEDKARTVIGSGSDQFRTSQKEIAARAVVSDRTAARACEELERIGLLKIETDREGENRPGRPSHYTLLDSPATYERSSDGEVKQRRNGVQTPSEAISDVSPKRTTGVRTSLYRERRSKEKEESAREQPVIPSKSALAAWDAATKLLATSMPGERFRTYIEPLQVVGAQADAIVLLDPTDHGGAGWVDEILRPLALETIEGFAGIVVVDQFALDELTVLDAFDLWLADYHEVTGRTAVTGSDEARKSFNARREEGRSFEELKQATRGCHADDYLRGQALDRPETILRKSKIARYIELGKSKAKPERAAADVNARRKQVRAEQGLG